MVGRVYSLALRSSNLKLGTWVVHFWFSEQKLLFGIGKGVERFFVACFISVVLLLVFSEAQTVFRSIAVELPIQFPNRLGGFDFDFTPLIALPSQGFLYGPFILQVLTSSPIMRNGVAVGGVGYFGLW